MPQFSPSTLKFEGCVHYIYMFSCFLLFWHCPFCPHIYQIFWRIFFSFFFNLHLTGFTSVFFILTIHCNNLQTLLSLFCSELQEFHFFTVSAFCLICSESPLYYLSGTLSPFSSFWGLPLLASAHWLSSCQLSYTRGKAPKSPRLPCYSWRDTLLYWDLCVHCILFITNTNLTIFAMFIFLR
jgi:hypothetical protein